MNLEILIFYRLLPIFYLCSIEPSSYNPLGSATMTLFLFWILLKNKMHTMVVLRPMTTIPVREVESLCRRTINGTYPPRRKYLDFGDTASVHVLLLRGTNRIVDSSERRQSWSDSSFGFGCRESVLARRNPSVSCWNLGFLAAALRRATKRVFVESTQSTWRRCLLSQLWLDQ